MDVAQSTIVPNIVIGSVIAVAGVIIYLLRVPLHKRTAAFERRMFGDRVVDTAERLQSPYWVGFVGLAGIGLGIVMIVYGIVGIVQGSA
ncbi:hypothetical protein [Microbacterium candidum]|uniref:Uncharacterized protein n=1 Tax=Microbacterium candidum TaxID=3041922 RepID=A0ABT7MX57_9MICO|nr:hypothetical protein [Microbacterium sp. ASV49]MDL9979025.1 hypothetical protein [Microbacterium sp. ASV49]